MIVMCSASEVSSESQNVSSIGTTTPSFTSDLSEGRKKKDKQHMEMLYMGLNHIKSVVQMVMMGISQMLQFKGILISMIGVVIQALRLIMDFKAKQAAPTATIMLKQQVPPSGGHQYGHYEGKSSAPGFEGFTPGEVSSAYSSGYDSFSAYNTRAH
ncbi:hypothetical protein M8J75_003774 [Diaphorina citri]|nr:hypothetical protein M8J75_003774 [Diaphorina citri]